MKLFEVQQDLFDIDTKEYHLVQCISADLDMSSGLSVEFNKRFDEKNRLSKFYSPQEMCRRFDLEGFACLHDAKCNVFNLVTKRLCTDKPNYEAVYGALCLMRQIMVSIHCEKVAMPHIGCGFDGLEWSKVRMCIESVFLDSDAELRVCYL